MSLISVSEWMFRSIGLDKSRLNIPIIDLASITYLPDTRSKSTLNFAKSFTKDLTLSIEFKEINDRLLLWESENFYGK